MPTIKIMVSLDDPLSLDLREHPQTSLTNINSRNIDDNFSLVNSGGVVRIMRMGKSPYNPEVRVPEFWKEEDFKRALKNKHVRVMKDGKMTVQPLADIWLKNSNRHTYDGLVFDAARNSGRSGDEMNMWSGFGVSENAFGDWSLMREHIADVLAQGEKASDDYLIRWIAWAIQNPTRAAEVAVALISTEKGTGKGMLGRALCKIFGGHSLHILQRTHLVGKFNAHFAMCGFLFSDEAIWPGFLQDEAVLKGLITEPTIQVERKGVDAVTMNNALKIMLASNSDRVVPVSENDRRYAVFKVSDKRAQDSSHFGAMQRQLDNGGHGAMLNDLKAMDLGGWHPRDEIPHTSALAGQKQHSLSPQMKWLHGLLDSGALPGTDVRENEARSKPLFDAARRLPTLNRWQDTEFASFLREWGCVRKRNNGSVWVFPPLEQMRDKWRVAMPWSDAFDDQVDDWSASID